jgi:microcystin-dependent protein
MADTFTANYEWTKPENTASNDTWGTKLNDDLDDVDVTVGGDVTTKDVSAGPTLTDDETAKQLQVWNGTLVGNVNVVVPDNKRRYFVRNETTGSYTVTAKTAAGTGVTIPQGGASLIYSDGTNVVKLCDMPGTTISTFILTLLDDTTAAAARTTLDAAQAPNSLTLETGIVDADKIAFYDASAAAERYTTKDVLCPTGKVDMFAGAAAPTGWLMCDGSAVSRATYAGLFGVIGTTYGVGDGSTTFNVPDMRSRSPVGAGQGTGLSNRTLASTGGEENHVLTEAEMPLHSHPWRNSNTNEGSWQSDVTGGFPTSNNGVSNRSAFTGTPSNTIGEQIGGAGSSNSHNNMHPYFAINFIIKT